MSTTLFAQEPVRTSGRGDSVVVRLLDVDLRTAVQALSPYLDHPAIVGALPTVRVSVETPAPIPRVNVAKLLREMLEANGAELSLDSAGTVYRARTKDAPKPAPPEPSPSRQSAAPELFVIRLQHAKASEVAATVNALYGRVSAFGEIGERQGTLSQQLQQQQVQSGVGAAPQIVPTVAGRNATLAGETTIVPDSRANSLIIRASRSDFDLIQAAVSQLDVRPLQVLIEVLIAEVNRNRSTDIGVEATMPTTQIKGSDSVSIAGAISSGGGLGGLALQVMGVSKLNIDATIRAVASRGNVHILNRPVLLAANNERAEINVGSQRPFVQIARVLATDNTARDQVVQYKDVGTRLSIIPTISSSGYVMLQIVQEVNAATAEQQFDAPVISTRSLETRLLVKDSQTIVLGGLTDTQHETVRVGVPILSSIPWLGALFGHQTSVSNETELLLFLTPRIIHDDAEADDVTGPRLKRADKIKP